MVSDIPFHMLKQNVPSKVFPGSTYRTLMEVLTQQEPRSDIERLVVSRRDDLARLRDTDIGHPNSYKTKLEEPFTEFNRIMHEYHAGDSIKLQTVLSTQHFERFLGPEHDGPFQKQFHKKIDYWNSIINSGQYLGRPIFYPKGQSKENALFSSSGSDILLQLRAMVSFINLGQFISNFIFSDLCIHLILGVFDFSAILIFWRRLLWLSILPGWPLSLWT